MRSSQGKHHWYVYFVRDSVENGTEAAIFCNDVAKEIFPTTCKLLEDLHEVDDDNIVPFRQTRNDSRNVQGKLISYHGYILSGDINESLKRAVSEFTEILSVLEESVTSRFAEIIDNPVVIAMAKLLDTQSFDYVDIDDLYEEVMIICDHFEKLFKANGCQCDLLKSEL